MLTASRRLSVLVAVFVIAAVAAPFAQTEKVYVTKTGAKYHRATCASLSRSKIEMALPQAAARYGACKICKPPVPAATPASTAGAPAVPATVPATVVPKSAPATSSQCQATTKKGAQCSRKVSAGGRFCWQHGR